MQTYKPCRRQQRLRWTIAVSLLLSASLRAQSTGPKKTDTDEPTIELSPFVVDSSRDEGYRATNTLAGTRINTNLRDVAAPISVITKDFMNDVGATSVNDIVAFQVGAEGTRDFAATTGQLGRTTDGPGQDPTIATRGRGLSNFDVTRDYFFSLTANNGANGTSSAGTSVGFDAYNLDAVTISRGPNSILAGLGSPSGIINYTTQLATTTKNSNEVSLRYGSFDDKRITLNTNQVLVKDLLALRFAGLWADKGFQQQPAYSKDKRAFLTATWRPLKKTTVRASYEVVRLKQRLPNTFTPEDDISQWIGFGKPSHAAGEQVDGNIFFQGLNAGGPAVLFNKDGSFYQAMDVSNQYQFQQRNYASVGIWQPLRFRDDTYGDWHHLNTAASDAKNSLNTFNVSVDQNIIENLDLNVAYVHEKLSSNQISLWRPDYVTYQVDVNRTLPWGAPNPHFGETYMYARGLDNKQDTSAKNDVVRASLAYTLDLRKHNEWLGHYNITAFGEKRRTENNFHQYNAVNAANAETSRFYYLGGTSANGYVAQAVPQTPVLVSNAAYYDTNGVKSTLNESYSLKSNTKNLTKLQSYAAVLQAYLFKDIVVATGGIRRDKQEAASSIGTAAEAPAYPPLAEAAKTTKTYGAVVHPLKWLDVFYSHSENFIPNAGAADLLLHPTASPTGVSKDYGISVTTLDGKLTAKVDWYEMTAANSPSPSANFPLAQWTLPFLETGYPTGGAGVIGAFQDLAQKAGVQYKPGIASGLITGDSRLTNAYTSDQVAKGVEFELTYNPTKNWRIFATVAKQEAKETNIAPQLTAFIKERLAYWQATPGLWTGQTTNKDWSGVQKTGQQVFNDNVLGDYVRYQSADGKPSTQLHKWRATFVTNYTFNEGPLKDFSVGGGLRYLDGGVIGNPVIRDASGQVVALDIAHPYKNSEQISVDVWIGYHWRIDQRRVLDLQLRGQDLQSDGGYRAIAANSDGNHAVYSIVPPRRYYLTATLKF